MPLPPASSGIRFSARFSSAFQGTTALRRTAWHEISWLHSGGVAYPFASSLFCWLFLVIRGDETTVVGAQLWISMVSEWFPDFDVVTICYIFNVSPNIHACWIILQRMSISCCETFLIFVNVFFFVNLAVPKQVLEVSMKYQASWHDHTNMAAIPKSCWFVELWFRHIGDDRKVPRYAERRQRRWGGYEDVLKVFEETRGTIKIERPEVKTNEIRKCPAYAKMFHILMFNWEIKAIYNN